MNDRADVAAAAGVMALLTTLQSTLPHPTNVRGKFPDRCSTHSLAEAEVAKEDGADFVVFGPVFATPSKESYGLPAGLAKLEGVAKKLAPFPMLALGGVDVTNARDCLRAGASGIAGISLFEEPNRISEVVRKLRQ